MKIGYTTMATPGLNLDEVIEAAKEYNFDAVDLRVHKDGEISEDITFEEAQIVKEKLGEIDLSGLLCYNSKIQQGKEEMEASILRCLEVAEKLDSKSVRIFSGKIESDEMLSDLCEVLNKVFEKYDGNVDVFLQNHASGGISCVQALKIAEKVKDKRYGFIFSPEQSYLMGEDYFELIPEVTKITKQIYIADVNEENLYCLIGEGVIPFGKILTIMKENGFDGYLTLKWEKCWRDYLPPHQKGFESFITYFKKEGII